MARTGLFKSDVKKARDSLVSQSLYPSVDAVRVALGNTGSKTTIHKYLRELEEEEGSGASDKSSISAALQDLVERLAARLVEEADARVEQAALEFSRKEQAHLQAHQQIEAHLRAARESAETLEQRLRAEIADHAKTREALQTETGARRAATQQNEQMKAELRQRQLALREKQNEAAKLNQEAARLGLEQSHTKQSLYEQLTKVRELEHKVEQLQSTQRHTGDLERQLVARIAEAELLGEQLKAAEAQLEPAKAGAREFELLLAQANAKIQAQEQIGDQLQAYLDKMTTGSSAKRTR